MTVWLGNARVCEQWREDYQGYADAARKRGDEKAAASWQWYADHAAQDRDAEQCHEERRALKRRAQRRY